MNCLETSHSFLSVKREGLKHYNATGNGNRDSLKSFKYRVISSQGTPGGVQGSTTRVWSLEQTVKPQERGTTEP